MGGGIRYIVCCDGCGVDALDNGIEYFSMAEAQAARQWVTHQGGWLLKAPDTDDQWLTCPECSGREKPKPHLSVVRPTLPTTQ